LKVYTIYNNYIIGTVFLSGEGLLMLVLGRKPGEYVMIGDNIKIMVVRSDEGDLRLAIEAPKDVSIKRGELLEEEKVS
jgi:carbon storage regulator